MLQLRSRMPKFTVRPASSRNSFALAPFSGCQTPLSCRLSVRFGQSVLFFVWHQAINCSERSTGLLNTIQSVSQAHRERWLLLFWNNRTFALGLGTTVSSPDSHYACEALLQGTAVSFSVFFPCSSLVPPLLSHHGVPNQGAKSAVQKGEAEANAK